MVPVNGAAAFFIFSEIRSAGAAIGLVDSQCVDDNNLRVLPVELSQSSALRPHYSKQGGDRFRLGHRRLWWRAVVDQLAT